MPTSGLDAVFYVDSVPEVAYDDGLFRVSYQIGKQARFQVIMPPKTFMRTKLLADEARARWQLGQLETGNVTAIRAKR